MTTRLVTAEIRKSDGTPWVAAEITFILNKVGVTVTPPDLYPPLEVSVVTNASGRLGLADIGVPLWANEEGLTLTKYKCILPDNTEFEFRLPAGGTTIDLADLKAAGLTTLDVGDPLLAVIESRTFLDLPDTPDTYTAQALKSVRVNAGGTALEFATPAGSGDALVANPLSQFAATTSAQLAGVISDEVGSDKLVFNTSPTLVTPVLGAATATSINKVAITQPASSATITVADGKTATFSNSITIAGTDSTVMTFPSTSATIARTDAGNTFTGNQVVNGNITFTDNSYDIGASGATRPKNAYLAGVINVAGGQVQFGSQSIFHNQGNGVVKLTNGGITGLNQFSLGATVPGTIGTAPANGQTFSVVQAAESLTIAAAPTTTTTMQVPANVIVLSVSVRVTTVIPTAATFTVKIGAQVFNTAAVSTAATSTDPGTAAGAWFNATAQGVVITPNLTPGAATGVVRITAAYIQVTPPTS